VSRPSATTQPRTAKHARRHRQQALRTGRDRSGIPRRVSMLIDVFAPSRQIERNAPQNLASAAKPAGPKNDSGKAQLWNSTATDFGHHQDMQDLRYMQLMNCQRNTPMVFDRNVAYVTHMPLHHDGHHNAALHGGASPPGWVASIPLAGLPVHQHSSQHGRHTSQHQHHQHQHQQHHQQQQRVFHSAEERAAYERFQAAQTVKPVGGSRSTTDVPALRTHSRRTWNGQLEQKIERTDNTPLFHSTLLRALAHS